MSTPAKATDFGGDLSEFLGRYKYQPELTARFDNLENVSLTPELLNEIVRWKVNRYVSLEEEQFAAWMA
jgi:hypothetical protein